MLDFLVTSRVRREMLRALWADRAVGSVSELARTAQVSFAAAHKELEAMRVAGLAVSERVGNTVVYRANEGHQRACLVRQMLDEERRTQSGSHTPTEDVRSALAAAGAPLGAAPLDGEPPDLAETVVAGVALAHDDATVARVLPVVLWRQRERLDVQKLVAVATRRNERQATGYFLELTGRLGGDRRLVAAATRLRDKRRTRARMFFTRATAVELRAAKLRTPRLARKWGYLMNMDLESFSSAFTKHTGVS